MAWIAIVLAMGLAVVGLLTADFARHRALRADSAARRDRQLRAWQTLAEPHGLALGQNAHGDPEMRGTWHGAELTVGTVHLDRGWDEQLAVRARLVRPAVARFWVEGVEAESPWWTPDGPLSTPTGDEAFDKVFDVHAETPSQAVRLLTEEVRRALLAQPGLLTLCDRDEVLVLLPHSPEHLPAASLEAALQVAAGLARESSAAVAAA